MTRKVLFAGCVVSQELHAICMQIARECNSSSRGPSTTKSKDIGGMGMGDVHKKFSKNILAPWCASGACCAGSSILKS